MKMLPSNLQKRLITGVISLLLFALSFASCSTIKNVHKLNQKVKSEKDSTAVTSIKNEDIIKTITTEKADTTIKVKGSTLSGSTSLKQLRKPFVMEDKNQAVTVSFDSLGDIKVTAKVKDKDIHVDVNKRSEQVINKHTKTDSKIVDKEETTTQEKKFDKDVKSFALIPWWLWLIIVIVGLIILFFNLKKKIPFL